MMLLHTGTEWSFEPQVVLPVAVTALIYARGQREVLRRTRNAHESVRSQMLFSVAGFTVLAIALISPLHEMGNALFSAHMIQHELLMAVAAPLLVLGKPAVPLIWGFPRAMRPVAGRLFSVRVPQLAAFLLHAAAIWIWHAPFLYDASVASEVVHAAQHVSFLGTALLFWWSVFHSRNERGNEGTAIIYLFLTAIHTILLGAFLTMSDVQFYSVYSNAGTRIWGLTALEDQQLGGLIMWIPGGIVYLGSALYLMTRWISASAARVKKSQVYITTAACLLIAFLSGCVDHRDAQWAAEMTGGSVPRGHEAIRSYGCMSCHSIPGVAGAHARVGPPLDGIASRSYIAGVLSNTPDHMIEWLRNPPGIDSRTAMPNMHVTERDARDIAAYLYTLK
ncbi:MAG TPA: cytochrome c oxidase assembly protein [Gemmatimonadaceae bacterium]|nr:cytochrome c oxidase assembly protein [Gemmatimonadaceae bacterium]